MDSSFEGVFSSPLLRGLLYGTGFALIELGFTCLFKDGEDGALRFAPDLRGHTTWAMVPGSMLGGLYGVEPLALHVHPWAAPEWNLALRLALYPLVIWLIEIVWGAYLFHGCRETRAWHYHGRWARFNGFIKLSMAPHWIGFGALYEALLWLIR